ncbi:Helicase PriA essential for oriC/DnaA-independent DNA replication [Olavius sp. associated proteobacterium Delta 1]|nr:Helicase PriA essential for oriC/DnaA-independent DNA replication [Olavius sp. associated proteobacterium Delta 1]
MTSDTRYIEVAIALPVFRTFTYSAAEPLLELLDPGKRVLAPFGRRRVTGYIFGPSRNLDHKELKPILDVLDEQPLFPPGMVPFFRWIAEYYKYPIGEVVKNALPGGLNVYDYSSITITDIGRRAHKSEPLSPIAKLVLEQLLAGPCRLSKLFKNIGPKIPGALLYNFEQSGWITRKWELSGARTKARLERFVRLADTSLPLDRLSKPRQKILDILKTEQEIALKKVKEAVPTAASLIKPLESAGYLTIEHKRVYRDPFGEPIKPDIAPILNREQQKAVSHACNYLNKGYHPFLLNGVTGSGKTEVYMQVAAAVLKKGRFVLVLVPEIALITQLERRFRARFGECVCVLHSGLSAGERYDQWTRILQGQATVAIGARSAIFAPFANLGVIVVDEEHDSSYKQEGKLRYNARDLAVVRAKQNQCIVILGSATPSMQSYYNVTINKFTELSLPKRVEERHLPDIRIVDLRQIRDARGIQRFITPELQVAMKETLERGEQVLLFLNRRGYASFPVCGACGQAMRCKHCDISLTLHQRSNAYRCHYCGYSRAATSSCDICGSTKIKHLGLGTEKLEDMLTSLYKKARIARMDRDTTTRKGSIIKLLKGLKNKSTDILVGTQMVAKGHDFPNITLVGIICADLSLSFPDFRAGERTFQLLAQVAGRAGRGNRPGRVILQTYNPEHFCISAAQNQDFKAFYQQEIGFRQALAYPPFSRMIQLKISGKDPHETEKHANLLGDHCRKLKTIHAAHYRSLEIMGPIEASLTRIAGRYRWQILLKGSNTGALHQFINQLRSESHPEFNHRRIQVAIDVDPVFLM